MQNILFNNAIFITDHVFAATINSALNAHHCFNMVDIITDLNEISVDKTQVVFFQISENVNMDDIVKLTELAKHLKLVIIADNKDSANIAYEIGAVDFILLSANHIRITQCLEKLIHLCPLVLKYHHNHLQKESDSQLIVRDVGKIRLIDINDVIWINGAGNYVELHCKHTQQPILHRETMKSLTERLADKGFIRIHRSTLVRKQAISELIPTDCGDYKVILKSNTTLNLSRRFKDNLESILNSCL